jgi:hypothetical protein
MLLRYFFIISTLVTVVAHCNNFKLYLLQSNIGDWIGEYTIRNSITGFDFITGYMTTNNNIETHNLCLSKGEYNIIMPKNNLEFGLIVCEQKFIRSGEILFFKISDRGCVIDKVVQQMNFVNTIFPIVYSYDVGSTSPINSYKLHSNLYSYNPTITPSYAFSYSFSGGSFLLNSTPIPTVLPLRYPTTLPSVSPLRYPTVLPSVSPLRYPTTLPSVSPLRYPTVLPTSLPSVSHLRYPTVQSLPIALFNTVIILSVTTNTPFDTQTQYAICSATAITLNINVNDCNYQNTVFTSSLSRFAHKLLTGYTATSSMTITVQTANPALFFASATSTLSGAASSGLFTANLVSSCQSLGITNTATVIGATTSGLQIIQPPTISPTFSPSLNITHIGLTSKNLFWNVETIVSISVFGSIFVLFIMYYCYHRNLSDIIVNYYSVKTIIPFCVLDSQNIDDFPVNADIVINSDDILLIDSGRIDNGLIYSGTIENGLIDSGLIDSGCIDSDLIDSDLIDNDLIDNDLIDVIPLSLTLNDNDYQIIVNE